MTESRTRFSLLAGEGTGAMLGLAGADSAAGDFVGAYSASTQQAVVIAYHLLAHGAIDRDALTLELADLGGDDTDPSVLRIPSEPLRRWIDSVRDGDPAPATEPSVEPSARVAPVGMWFRHQPDVLIESAIETARLTHLDGPSAVASAATAGAVAAACFAQNGRDLLMAVIEIAQRSSESIAREGLRFARTDEVGEVVGRLGAAGTMLGDSPAEIMAEVGTDPVGRVVAALVVAAPSTTPPEQVVGEMAEVADSAVCAIVGAVVGARVGLRTWPWRIPNDTWFVALGQRLIAGTSGLDDLPIPYEVEQRLTYVGDVRLI